MSKIYRVTTRQVGHYWETGQAAQNGGSGNLWTDGRDIYSYRLRIGYTDPERGKVAIRYQSPHFRSMTTSIHVGAILRYADVVEEPNA